MLLVGSCLVLSGLGFALAEELPAKTKTGPAPEAGSKSILSAAKKDKNPGATVKESAPVAGKKSAFEKASGTSVGKSAGCEAEKGSSSLSAKPGSTKSPEAETASKDQSLRKASTAGTIKTESPEKEKGSRAKKNVSAPDSKGSVQGHGANHKTASSAGGSARLVPPPPPSVPTTGEMGMPGMGTTMIFVGENIDYMSAADLRDLKERTAREIKRFRRDVEDSVSAAAEKQQRAGSFDQLFAEGVISRRELEASKHESEKANQELSDKKQSLTMLEQKHARIEQRLAFLNKSQKSANSSVLKKRSRK